jgi:hypothetical protein
MTSQGLSSSTSARRHPSAGKTAANSAGELIAVSLPRYMHVVPVSAGAFPSKLSSRLPPITRFSILACFTAPSSSTFPETPPTWTFPDRGYCSSTWWNELADAGFSSWLQTHLRARVPGCRPGNMSAPIPYGILRPATAYRQVFTRLISKFYISIYHD